VIDLHELISKMKFKRNVKVVREPIALAMSKNSKQLFVANHLPRVRPFLDDENPYIGAEVSVVDVEKAYVGGYSSDDVAIVSLAASKPCVKVISLGEKADPPSDHLGEQYFNDASLCRQQWQSCATCHPDGRSDVMYWDLLNDGLGNTKNTKSLLMSALTPPAMWRGVRKNAAEAIRAGIHHILFTEIRSDQAEAIEAYLLHMKSVPSPYLDAGKTEAPKTEQGCVKCHTPGVQRGVLTQAALRGKKIFEGKAGCVKCHPHPLFTKMEKVDPGLGSGVLYDVPTLIEVWRTAPYLHSGDALTLRETITDFNFMQKRGQTKDLSEQELNNLIAYLKSL